MATTHVCGVPSCGKPYLARGYCSKHYRRWRTHGDPLKVTGTEPGAAQRFYEALSDIDTEECIIWPFSRDNCGYGEMGVPGGGKRDVHPLVCARARGPKPKPSMVARHLCGNGRGGCVNPKHLVWGTMKENSADSLRHGTLRRGGDKINARFTDTQIMEIRELIARRYEKGMKVKDIAAIYGCDPRRITDITKGRAYATIHSSVRFAIKQETAQPDGTTHVVDPSIAPMFSVVYRELRAYFLANGRSPSVRKLGALSRCSNGSVRKAARLLESNGYVETDEGKEYTMVPTDLKRTLAHS